MKKPTIESRLSVRERPQSRPPIMFQSWRDLLFLHWKYDKAEIQATLPQGIFVDTFDGEAYLGIVPFSMQNVRPRFCPTVPGISNFLELNVRTYVHDEQGNPGVWFYSLDANQRLAVSIARNLFGLPYNYARMEEVKKVSDKRNAEMFHYRSQSEIASTESTYTYALCDQLRQPDEQSLEFFLLERYILFSQKNNRLYKGRVNHIPYPVYTVEVDAFCTNPLSCVGFHAIRQRESQFYDHAIASPGVDVSIYWLEELGICSG